LTLVGSNPTEEVKALADGQVRVTGYVTDAELAEFYKQSGVAVVPLRFGAGVKGKVLEALHYAMPIVTTSVGAQGLQGLEEMVPVRDGADEIAQAIVELMQTPTKWELIAKRGSQFVHERFSQQALRSVFELDIHAKPAP
jgi:glycosyltransferase involved in cell wall biosynthesis